MEQSHRIEYTLNLKIIHGKKLVDVYNNAIRIVKILLDKVALLLLSCIVSYAIFMMTVYPRSTILLHFPAFFYYNHS
jgi:hypothetical protein